MKLQLFILVAAFAVFANSFKLQSGIALCNECMKYMEDISSKVLDNDEECEERAQKMCDILSLPELMDKKCRQHVIEGVSKIVKSIKDSKPPRDICTDLRLCRAQ
uniref:Saposin B-type domain-containing protein n=1 Tax=Panagrolaimus sp. PS1159 TaxID=55785 RepID=A0AC35GUG9_9BILA